MRIPDPRVVIRRDPLVAVVTLAALVPVAAAMVRALGPGRALLGDNAMIATRAHDVLTRHHPLLGTWSSASVDSGVPLNHPGPLLFDLLAPFVRLFGMQRGTAVGMALLNGAAIVAAALIARRLLGRRATLLVLLGALALGFTLGGALLVDPWNPHATVVPFLALAVATWGIALGDRRSVAWFVALGSFCVQVHLGAVVVVPLLGVVSSSIGWWSQRSTVPHPLRPDRRWAVEVSALFFVLWAQPLAETAVNGAGGNLVRLATSGGGGESVIGAANATRFVSAVLLQAPWRLRSGFMAAVPATGFAGDGSLAPVATRGLVESIVSLVALTVVLALIWVLAGARGLARLRALVVVAGLSMAAAWLSLTVMPIGPFGLTAHQMRWLWPLAAAFWAAIAFVLAAVLVQRPSSSARAYCSAACAAAALAVAAVSTPSFVQPAGPAVQAHLEPIVADLVEQLSSGEIVGVVLVDHSGTPLFDGTWDAVVAALVERGTEVRVDDEALARHYGAARLADGSERQVVTVRWGSEARVTPSGAERIAFVDPDPTDASRAIAVYLWER